MRLRLRQLGRWAARTLLRRHGSVKSFDRELERAGGLMGRADMGVQSVPTEKVVGSVSRWQTLRSDFFYRRGQAMTARYRRVGKAMEQGTELPAIDVYKIKRPPRTPSTTPPVSEYYVVDGHHRVAMARQFGRAFLDARVVEYRVGDEQQPAASPGMGAENQADDGDSPDETRNPQ